MAQLTNSVIDFQNRIIGSTSLEDYFTFNLKKILDYIETCTDDFFEWYLINDDDKLERIALELYGDANYWDILLIINGKDALFDMPYSFDTVSKLAEELANRYAAKISNLTKLPQVHIDQMQAIYEEKFRRENEENRPLRIVKPSRLQEFIQKAYESGCFV